MNWTKTLKGDEFHMLYQSCVYGWFRGNRCLYIGHSSRGILRIYNHEVVGLLDNIEPDDELRFIWCKSLIEARKLEKMLMLSHDPYYNKSHNWDNSVTFQKQTKDIINQIKPEP